MQPETSVESTVLPVLSIGGAKKCDRCFIRGCPGCCVFGDEDCGGSFFKKVYVAACKEYAKIKKIKPPWAGPLPRAFLDEFKPKYLAAHPKPAGDIKTIAASYAQWFIGKLREYGYELTVGGWETALGWGLKC